MLHCRARMGIALHAMTFDQVDARLVCLVHGVRGTEADSNDMGGMRWLAHATNETPIGSPDALHGDAPSVEYDLLTDALAVERLPDR